MTTFIRVLVVFRDMNLKSILLVFALLLVLSTASAYGTSHTKILGLRELDNKTIGIAADLTVEVREGQGRVLVETKPLTQIDTQASARLATEVACSILERDCSKLDFIYVIKSDFGIIGGPSAGSAMTAAAMAALQGTELYQNVFVTGTITPSGNLGHVGGMLEKAEAAYGAGADIFIIPTHQELVYVDNSDEPINLTTLAEKNWGLKVIPADDIIDAYKHLTGYQITVRIVTSSDIASQKYDDIMKKLSDELIHEAEKNYNKADGDLIASALELGNEDEIKQLLQQADEQLDLSKDSYANNNFYSASSFSVRSLLHSNLAKHKTGYFADTTGTYLESKLSEINFSISVFETLFIKNKIVDHYGDIEIYAVVLDRLREAELMMDEAYEAFYEEDFERAIYLMSYAEVRKNTAYNWVSLISEFKGNLYLQFDSVNLKEKSLERIEQSKTSIMYAETVVDNRILAGAKEHLESAIDAYNDGKFVFALFEASKARAESNLAMEIRSVTDETLDYKLSSLENEARVSIKKAQEKGLLPILALS